jgi:hypothetical protein
MCGIYSIQDGLITEYCSVLVQKNREDDLGFDWRMLWELHCVNSGVTWETELSLRIECGFEKQNL